MSLNPTASFVDHHQDIMELLRKISVLKTGFHEGLISILMKFTECERDYWTNQHQMLILTLHKAHASLSLGNKVLHIPEKIIGGVIDIVQSHKNKPSTQATFQQSIQTQTTFNQQGNPQGSTGNVQPSWTGPAPTGAGFQGQFQAQGQYGYGNQGTGSYQGAPTAPTYPANNAPAITGVASGQYPSNPSQYPSQQGNSQSQNQNQYQNFQNQGQFQNQNQQGNFQSQNQNQVQNQNSQSGQYGSGNYQGTGQYAPSNGNYQNVGQNNNGNYQGNSGQSSGGSYQTGQSSSGNYHNSGQASGGNYQNVGQNGGSSNHGQTGNYQTTQTGSYQGTNGQYNHQQGQYGQTGQNGSGYYQGSQQTSSQSGQSSSGSQTGSSGSSGFQTSHQTGVGPGCVCQPWTKPPNSPILSDEPPKPDEVDKKIVDTKPDAKSRMY